MDALKTKIEEISTDVKELVKTSIIHNELLRTHEARSLALTAKMDKIEPEVTFHTKLLKIGGAIFMGGFLQYLINHFL